MEKKHLHVPYKKWWILKDKKKMIILIMLSTFVNGPNQGLRKINFEVWKISIPMLASTGRWPFGNYDDLQVLTMRMMGFLRILDPTCLDCSATYVYIISAHSIFNILLIVMLFNARELESVNYSRHRKWSYSRYE